MKLKKKDNYPINFLFLKKEIKNKEGTIDIVFCKEYNGIMVINTFYKSNSNILDE